MPIKQTAADEPQSPVADQPAAADQSATAKPLVKARVLLDHGDWKADQVIQLPASEVESYVGIVDADPAAVAYAESLGKQE